MQMFLSLTGLWPSSFFLGGGNLELVICYWLSLQRCYWNQSRWYPLLSHYLDCLILDANQVIQAWVSLSECVLITTNDFLVIHVPGNGSQDELLHHPARDASKAGRSVVPHIFLLAFFEHGSDMIHQKSSGLVSLWRLPAPSAGLFVFLWLFRVILASQKQLCLVLLKLREVFCWWISEKYYKVKSSPENAPQIICVNNREMQRMPKIRLKNVSIVHLFL